MTRNVCIIPARMASTRFPGKPLAPLLGLPLILHISRRCKLDEKIDRVIIATCDDDIRTVAEADGVEVIMTADTHPGCVDRTEEAIQKLTPALDDDRLVLMVQGDEVMVTPDMTAAIIDDYTRTGAPVINLASPLNDPADQDDPNCVKVVAGLDGRALFFSRSPIPSRSRAEDVKAYQQTGIIGFSREFLGKFGELPQTPLEIVERIDMLRVLESGYNVQIVHAKTETIGIDTPQDRDRAEMQLRQDPVTARYMKIPQP